MSQSHVEPGQLLAGKYRVERQLGVGGMGIVVAATHIQLDQHVALKFLLPEALANPEAVQRFLREARASVKLKSEHVARVSDVGTLENGAPYIVMEYLDGYDLGRELARVGRLPAEQATEYVLQACVAIAEAHTLGIVHRDIKPPNLFLTRRSDGTALVKVLDFGISKAITGQSDVNLTRTQSVMGSPSYMSPEQMRSARYTDHRSDIWSLGVVLYELLAGRVPWGGDSFSAVCLKVAMEPLPAMELPPGVLPPGLEAIVSRCLEKDITQRFQSVAELALALARYTTDAGRNAVQSICRTFRLTAESVASPGAGPVAPNSSANPSVLSARPFDRTTMGTASGQVGRGRGSMRKIFIGGGLLVTLMAGGVIALVVAGGGGTTKNPTAWSNAAAVVSPPTPDAAVATPPIDAAVATPPIDATVATPPIDAAAIASDASPDAAVIKKKDRRRQRPPGDLFDSRK